MWIVGRAYHVDVGLFNQPDSMTTTFILAFTQGAAEAVEGANILTDGFGMIATVAMTPIITLQILGLIFGMKLKKKGEQKNEE